MIKILYQPLSHFNILVNIPLFSLFTFICSYLLSSHPLRLLPEHSLILSEVFPQPFPPSLSKFFLGSRPRFFPYRACTITYFISAPISVQQLLMSVFILSSSLFHLLFNFMTILLLTKTSLKFFHFASTSHKYT